MIEIITPEKVGEPFQCFDHIISALRGEGAEIERDARVMVGAHLLPPEVEIPDDVWIFNFEQVSEQNQWFTDAYVDRLIRHRVLDYSPTNIGMLDEIWGIEAQLLAIGDSDFFIDPRLVADGPGIRSGLPDFFGSLNRRRIDVIGAGAFRVVPFGTYGENLAKFLRYSPCVANIHYYDAQIFEIVRAAICFSNMIPVMSEVSGDQECYPIPDLFMSTADLIARSKSGDYPDPEDQFKAWTSAMPSLSENMRSVRW